jgi:hypothetical protein
MYFVILHLFCIYFVCNGTVLTEPKNFLRHYKKVFNRIKA